MSPSTTIAELRASIAESAVETTHRKTEAFTVELPANFRIAVPTADAAPPAIFALGDGKDELTLEAAGFAPGTPDRTTAFRILSADDDDEQ